MIQQYIHSINCFINMSISIMISLYCNYRLCKIIPCLDSRVICLSNLLILSTANPLKGPIFSNAQLECMYGHFTGYNANTIPSLEGQPCDFCHIPIDQLQQNELLMILRDNILNPCNNNILYYPEYNRFKLLVNR